MLVISCYDCKCGSTSIVATNEFGVHWDNKEKTKGDTDAILKCKTCGCRFPQSKANLKEVNDKPVFSTFEVHGTVVGRVESKE